MDPLPSYSDVKKFAWDWKYPIAGACTTLLGAPVVIAAAGFTSGGIAAGSFAAKAMGAFYGGSTCGLMSVMQSSGAAGLGLAGKSAAIAIGSAAGYGVKAAVNPGDPGNPGNPGPEGDASDASNPGNGDDANEADAPLLKAQPFYGGWFQHFFQRV